MVRQQRSRMLGETTRSGGSGWCAGSPSSPSPTVGWAPWDVEDFTVSLTSGSERLAIVDDPWLSPDVADVLRLPHRCPL